MERFIKTSLAAYLNFLRAKHECYTGVTRVRSRPYYAMVDPCDLCQLRCPTCPTGMENAALGTSAEADTTYRTDRARMESDVFDALLDELGEYLFLVEFHSWGEPLLNRNLPSLVRAAKAREIVCHMHTNLSVELSDEFLEELLESGLDFLFASTDGFSQETYERFRVGGNLELVKSNMERAARARDRLGLGTAIIYKFLIFSWNEHELPAAQQWASDRGIAFHAQDASVPEASWLPSYRKDERPFLNAADVDVLREKWSAVGKADYWREHERHAYWMPIDPGSKWIPTDGPKIDSFCGWHYGVTVVQPRGHIAPCCITAKAEDRFGQLIPGKVSHQDVWNNELFRGARAAFVEGADGGEERADTVCTRCYFPDAFKQVFSNNDFKIVSQFFDRFRGTDPILDGAFELLSGDESEEHRARYVAYFDQHLRGYFEQADDRSAAGSAP